MNETKRKEPIKVDQIHYDVLNIDNGLMWLYQIKTPEGWIIAGRNMGLLNITDPNHEWNLGEKLPKPDHQYPGLVQCTDGNGDVYWRTPPKAPIFPPMDEGWK